MSAVTEVFFFSSFRNVEDVAVKKLLVYSDENVPSEVFKWRIFPTPWPCYSILNLADDVQRLIFMEWVCFDNNRAMTMSCTGLRTSFT